MTWGFKKYCSFLSCCSTDDTKRLRVHRVNRHMATRMRSPKRRQGLSELMSSYQSTKNDQGRNMKEWALEWARSGTLLRLARIAYSLGKQDKETEMEFVCLNAALIVAYLPKEGTPYLKQFLDCMRKRISGRKRRNALGVYRLLLVLMRIEHFRNAAVVSGFMHRLHERYQKLVFSKRTSSYQETEDETMSETSSESISSDEEITEDDGLFENERIFPKGTMQGTTRVPKLSIAWARPSSDGGNVPRRNTRSLSVDKSSARTDIETRRIYDRDTEDRSSRSKQHQQDHTGEGSALHESGSHKRFRGILKSNRTETWNDLNGMKHVLHALGLSETITLLGHLNDTCFTQKYNIGTHVAPDWKLESFHQQKQCDALDRERMAILEAFLCISPSVQSAELLLHQQQLHQITHEFTQTIVADIFCAIQDDTANDELLQHHLTAYVEFSLPTLHEVTNQDNQCLQLFLKPEIGEGTDLLLETLVKKFTKLTSVRRPGDETFRRMSVLLILTSGYLEKSPDPTKIVNNLIFALGSIQRTFLKSSGHIVQWTEAEIQAFSSVLSFYDLIFKKCKSLKDTIVFEKSVAQNMEEEWMRLLKDFTENMCSDDPFSWLPDQKRHEIVTKTLKFFTSLMRSLAHLHKQKENMQNGYVDEFDFLLMPRTGIVSMILHAEDIQISIHAEALRMLMASCALTRSSFLPDVGVMESHLRPLTQQTMELFHKPCAFDKEDTLILALYLQVITTIMQHCSEAAVRQILNSGIADYLIREIRETVVAGPCTQCIHSTGCYAPSTQPPTTGESRRFVNSQKREPIEILKTSNATSATASSSDASDADVNEEAGLQREITCMVSFNADLPFEDGPQILQKTLSSASSSESSDSDVHEEVDIEGETPCTLSFNADLPFKEGTESLEEALSSSSRSSDQLDFNPPLRTHSHQEHMSPFYEGTSVEQIDNELFGHESDVASLSSVEEGSEEWPSDLSIHGDIDEDGKRWEAYQVKKQFEQGRISLAEKINKLEALSSTSSTVIEEKTASSRAVPSLPVPLLNFDQLRSVPSEPVSSQISGRVSGQPCNPPFVDSPAISNPPKPSTERIRQPLESGGASTLDPSTAHRKKGSVLSSEFGLESARHVMNDTGLRLSSVEFLIELLVLLDKHDYQTSINSTSLVAAISSVLFQDLNGPQFKHLVPMLVKRLRSRQSNAITMLRLLSEELFEVDQYVTLDRVHKGEVAQIKRCAVKRSGKGIPQTCVVKVIDSPREFLQANESILNVYSEVSLMERVSKEPGFCQIYDFGVHSDSAYIVMQDCQCSLSDWIDQFPVSSPWAIRLVLNIFLSIARSVNRLHQKVIVHFDLKCSNILLKGGSSNKGFWFPQTENPEFDILLADFGVARCYEGQDCLGTVRNRGTEYSKAPEMLLITDMLKRNVRNHDRRRMKGVGLPSDVWALGCLLFELLTGELLHLEADWARFYTRVTQNVMPLLDESKIKLLDASYRTEILDLLQFILVRDPNWRPSVSDIIDKVTALMESDTLPTYCPPMSPIAPPMPIDSLRRTSVERISQSEWMRTLLEKDPCFSVYLSKLRLSVCVLEDPNRHYVHRTSHHHHQQHQQSNDLMHHHLSTATHMGVVFVEDLFLSSTRSDLTRHCISRVKAFCSRRRMEALFLSTSSVESDTAMREFRSATTRWWPSTGVYPSLCLCTVQGFELPFFDFLLEVIMSLEECSCLQAISILKERVREDGYTTDGTEFD